MTPIRFLTTFSSIMLLTSTAAMATPTVTFKDVNNPTRSTYIPHALNTLIQDVQNENSNAYKIIVYKNENHYILYVLSGTTWEAKKIRADFDTTGKMTNLIHNYSGGLNELKPLTESKAGTCPDTSVEFLAISAYPGVAAVNTSIATVSQAANKKFKTMTILSNHADGKTYKNWLSCPNLKGIYTIGHGAPDEMIVGNDDILRYDFFNQPEMKNKYKNTTVVFNACQVYNYPMATSVMYGNATSATEFTNSPGPNALEYMGGHTNLLMYSSETSSACFLVKAMDGEKMDYDTLKKCIGNQDIHFQNFGLSNPGQYFNQA